MNITGKIVEIFAAQQVTATFKKREFVIEFAENPQYPEVVKFECIQDKCGILDNFQVGQDVEIHFNLKGRKWTDPKGEAKYFNTLQAWKINTPSSQPQMQEPPVTDGSEDSTDGPPMWLNNDNDEDVPF